MSISLSDPTTRVALVSFAVGTLGGYLLARILAPTTVVIVEDKSTKAPQKDAATSDADSDYDSDSSIGSLADTPTSEECKLVLVVRTDLGMTKGKIAAQCSHATLACYKALLAHAPGTLRAWERGGQAKIATQVKSEEELLVLQATAASLGLCARVVRDAGRTQIAAGSVTVLGVGPGPRGVVDRVTGGLKLL
ncbi:PTH2-domain-containing protein [Trichodelitschia bisporula]|uniref:peptidyl-tRNA hydrolase n=1 Tax=Trichodelitschia bisporula TaxID=703511 RepID=A0A6G1I987_9PEZI|nr:PTH2-domain-containing protein [Trichodelitschia bisporula]